MSIVNEIQKLDPSALIELYEIDLTPFGDIIRRYHNGTNELLGNIIWRGNEYVAFPIYVQGYAINSKGEIPRPTMKISNILGLVGSLIRELDDIIGAKVTRIRTFAKFLDAANFASGINTDAQYATFVDDVYYIERKSIDTPDYIEMELTSPFDVQGEKIPNRQILQNICTWVYRGDECGYAGPDVADNRNNEVSSTAYKGTDVCAKNLTACRYRFGVNGVLPFGGFPGANKY